MNNSGTDENAIFDFVIPRGEPGGGGVPDVLATIDTQAQSPSAGGALIFNETPLVSGNSITHQAGSTDIETLQQGVYQAFFQSNVSVNPGTAIPSTLQAQLNLGGAPVAGGISSHTFTATGEAANVSFSVPFAVTAASQTLQVIANQDGYTFENTTLTVVRLGNSANVVLN